MNKLVYGILTVILCLSACGAFAQEIDLPEVRWTYPVSLTEIQSKYAILVNGDNMLDEDFAVTGYGYYQFRVSIVPVQWDESYFGIYVNLSEADHGDTWTPFSSDVLYIDPEGNLIGDLAENIQGGA